MKYWVLSPDPRRELISFTQSIFTSWVLSPTAKMFKWADAPNSDHPPILIDIDIDMPDPFTQLIFVPPDPFTHLIFVPPAPFTNSFSPHRFLSPNSFSSPDHFHPIFSFTMGSVTYQTFTPPAPFTQFVFATDNFHPFFLFTMGSFT